MNDIKRFIAKHLLDIPRSGIRDFFDIVSSQKHIISLGVGEPDFVTPWHIREASIRALEQGTTSYTENLGLPALREVISAYVEKKFGVRYDPSCEILVTVGVSEAMDLAIRAITETGDEILFHEPSYVSYSPLIRFAHGVPVGIPLSIEEGFILTGELIKPFLSNKTKALILNFPTNPTGAVLDVKQLESIAEVAIKHDLLVISDEIYAELTYEGIHKSIASMEGMKERTIFLHGFSKAWAMTGFRIGYACAPAPLIEAMMKIHQYSMLCAPIIAQYAAIEAMCNGQDSVQEMVEEYRRRRNFIHASLNDMGLKCHLPKGAFYAFPSIIATGLTSKEFCLRLLNEEKVACVPGTAFGKMGEGYIRCAYATSMDKLKEAMERMRRFVKKFI